MEHDLDSARRYRQRAEGLRSIAEQAFDKKMKQILLEIAEDYERMARSREALSAGEKKLKRR